MKYSPVLALGLAMLVAGAPSNSSSPLAPVTQQCPDNFPPTGIDIAQGGFNISFVICCPGIISIGRKDSVCLVGGDCGVVSNQNSLTTTGSCQATVPLTATDYVQRISSAYSAAGKPPVHNSAIFQGEITGTSSASSFVATGVAVTTPVTIDIGGVPMTEAAPVTAMPTPMPTGNALENNSTSNATSTTSAVSSTVSGAAVSRSPQGPAAALLMAVLGALFL